MRSWLQLLLLLLGLGATSAFAVEPEEVLEDPALEARARAISQELRCVVCQNQSIDDSNAPLAKDMRMLVRERIQRGDSDDEVRAFLVQRYGNFVLLRPPLQLDTLALWLSPFLFLAVGGALVWSYLRRLARQADRNEPLSAAEEAELKRLADEG